MKTAEEIKKGLECCMGVADCLACPYKKEHSDGSKSCVETSTKDALAYIQQLERERDAAVEGLHGHCWHCIHFERGKLLQEKETCMNCINNFDDESLADNWQWRGVQEVQHG